MLIQALKVRSGARLNLTFTIKSAEIIASDQYLIPGPSEADSLGGILKSGLI